MKRLGRERQRIKEAKRWMNEKKGKEK